MNIACSVVVSFLLIATYAVASAQDLTRSLGTEPELRNELLQRAEEDQKIRQDLIKAGVEKLDSNILAKMREIDAENTARMKEIFEKHGWPSPNLVGEDGAAAAFLLLQHSDHAFQKQVLPSVEKAFKEKKISGQNYALLLDRVLVREGKSQIYGTQAKDIADWKDREPVFETIADEANLDERRQTVGLPPLADYRRLLRDFYFPESK